MSANQCETVPADKYELAARIAIDECNAFVGVMDARRQRRIFGCALFGRKTIEIQNTDQGRIVVRFWARIDYVSVSLSFDDVCRKAQVFAESGYVSW